MKVFAKTAFRYLGIDYPYGWQDLPQSLADTLHVSGKVAYTDNLAGGNSAGNEGIITTFTTLSDIPAGFVGYADVEDTGILYKCDGTTITPVGRFNADLAVADKLDYFKLSNLLLYRLNSTIVTNGGSVSESDLQSIKGPLDLLMRSSVFAKLTELHIPVGVGYLSALCKLVGKTTLVMTGTDIVDGDYTQALGLAGNGSTKTIATGFTPPASPAAWGFAVYPTGLTLPTGSRIICGSGNNSYLGFASTGMAKINNSADITLPPKLRMLSAQTDSVLGARAYYGGYLNNTQTAGVTSSNQIHLLSYAGSLFSTGSVGGFAAWDGNLSSDELNTLQRFFVRASEALGRVSIEPSINCVGDSIAAGYGLTSPTTERYSALLTSKLGGVESNSGLSGTVMSSYTPDGSSGNWVTIYKTALTAKRTAILIVELGYNDSRSRGDVVLFESEYSQWLEVQLAMGVKPKNILLLSPIRGYDAASNTTSLLSFGAAVKRMAEKYRMLFLDTYPLTDGHTELFQADLIHLNAAGHIVIRDAILNVLSSVIYNE
jgi:lysophospholipase L1-like esterase